MLLEHDCSLAAANRREIAVYRRNRRLVLDGLREHLAPLSGVSWNSPDGGFFIVVRVPFPADAAALECSAREHGVLWTPMRDFYAGPGGEHELRLSCSTLEPPAIAEGVTRLAAFVARATADRRRDA
jgi:(S)-3,5-dihydroxyphenylglycine transaminase